MIVTCESCDRSFNLDERLVKTAGSKVRCSKCRHVFVVHPPEPAAAPELSEEDLFPGSLFDETSGKETGGDLDLSDIEKMLEVEEAPGETPRAAADILAGDSLDLSDFEKILDGEGAEDLADEEGEEEPDLVFDLSEEVEQAAASQVSVSTELDLGDLEKMFEADEEKQDLVSEELSMTLDAEESLPLEEETLGDLALELDAMEDPEPVSAEDEKELEFDLSSPEEEAQELDFDLEPDAAPEEARLELVLPEEPALPIEEELLFPLEMEAEASEEKDAPVVEEILDFGELTPVGGLEEASATEEAAPVKDFKSEFGDFGDDADLDFPDDAVPDFSEEPEDAVQSEGAFQETESVLEEELEEPGMSEGLRQAVASHEGMKKVLFGGVLAVFLILIAFAVIAFLQVRGIVYIPFLEKIRVPFVGQLKVPESPDAGNLKMVTLAVDARFLDAQTGRLFIVIGKVKNGYDVPRSQIQVSGRLYVTGKKLVKTEAVYCGNMISDLELGKLSGADIKARLGAKTGEAAASVKPGEERPFMIVFTDLPESLEEYDITVLGSLVAGK